VDAICICGVEVGECVTMLNDGDILYLYLNVGNVSCAVFEASPSVIALSVISLFIFEASPTKPRPVKS